VAADDERRAAGKAGEVLPAAGTRGERDQPVADVVVDIDTVRETDEVQQPHADTYRDGGANGLADAHPTRAHVVTESDRDIDCSRRWRVARRFQTTRGVTRGAAA
jgi:hypothetical protein